MKLFEFQAKELLRDNGIAVPEGAVATTADEAGMVAGKMAGDGWVIKAQILAGGRGQGHIRGDDLKTGIRFATNLTNVVSHSRGMLGRSLITPQTDSDGQVINQVYVEKKLPLDRELALSIVVDESSQRLLLLLSPEGGADIEASANNNAELVTQLPLSLDTGVDSLLLAATIDNYGLSKTVAESFRQLIDQSIKLVRQFDLTLLEINPVGVVDDVCVALDAKVIVDDNSLYRQDALRRIDETGSSQSARRRASRDGFNFIPMEGDIACMTVGAGLSMATIDSLVQSGGRPANFLDLPPDSKVNRVTSALELLLANENTRCVLINVFGGGIMRCDTVSDAIQLINRVRPFKVPVVVRLAGTNAELANRRLRESMPGIVRANNLSQAAEFAVQLASAGQAADPASENSWIRQLIQRIGGQTTEKSG